MWGGMREWKRKRRMRGSEKGGGEKKRVGHMNYAIGSEIRPKERYSVALSV